MLFTNTFIDAAAVTLAAELAQLGAGADLSIGLFSNDITPDPALIYTDLVPITTNGIGPKAMGAGVAIRVWDVNLGVWGFQLREPAGGLNFVTTSAPTTPITAYGWFLYNSDTEILLATGRFQEPKVFTIIGDFAEISAIVGWLAAPFIGDLPTS